MVRPELHKVGVTIQDPQHFDAIAQERDRGCRDHGIRGRRGTTREEDCRAMDFAAPGKKRRLGRQRFTPVKNLEKLGSRAWIGVGGLGRPILRIVDTGGLTRQRELAVAA